MFVDACEGILAKNRIYQICDMMCSVGSLFAKSKSDYQEYMNGLNKIYLGNDDG